MDPARILPLAIPLVFVAVIALRARRERPLYPDRLWIAPVVISVLIGSGLYFTPHPLFGPGAYLAFAVACLGGFAFGWWRAHATVLRHDADTDTIMASRSSLAVAVLAGIIVLRLGARGTGRSGGGGRRCVDAVRVGHGRRAAARAMAASAGVGPGVICWPTSEPSRAPAWPAGQDKLKGSRARRGTAQAPL